MVNSLKQWVTEVTTGTAHRWHWVALAAMFILGRGC